MIIQHNMSAMNSNRMFQITAGVQNKSTEKLSSGYKINRAADDAAGLSISEKMRRQIRGLTQASKNAQDGISLVQTAEGALGEVHSMLQRMNELSVKCSNDTLTSVDRSYVQSEIDNIISEIDRVGNTTTFNEQYIFKGTSTESTGTVTGSSGSGSGVTKSESTGDYPTVKVTPTPVKSKFMSSGDWTTQDGENTAKLQFDLSSFELDYPGDVTFTIFDDYYTINVANDEVFDSDKVTAKLKAAFDANPKISYDDGQVTASASGSTLTFSVNKKASEMEDTFLTDSILGKTIKADGKKTVVDASKVMVKKGNTVASLPHTNITLTAAENYLAVDGAKVKLGTVENKGTFVKSIMSSATGTASVDKNDKNVKVGSYSYNGTDWIDDSDHSVVDFIVNDGDVDAGAIMRIEHTFVSDFTNSTLNGLSVNADATLKNSDLGSRSLGDIYVQIKLNSQRLPLQIELYTWQDDGSDSGDDSDSGSGGSSDSSSEEEPAGGLRDFELQVGAEAGQHIGVKISAMNSNVLGIDKLKTGETNALGASTDNARNSISTVKSAIARISKQRSSLGAYQNRLEHTIKSLNNVTENTTSAESEIRDTDMAEEMVRYSNNNILMQASQSILAQSNKSNQNVINVLLR